MRDAQSKGVVGDSSGAGAAVAAAAVAAVEMPVLGVQHAKGADNELYCHRCSAGVRSG